MRLFRSLKKDTIAMRPEFLTEPALRCGKEIRKLSYYKGFPEQSTPVFNFCLFINERQGIRLRYYKRSC
jgi:hypothetical protein